MIGLGVVGQSVSNTKPSVIDTGFGTSTDCANWSSWLLNSGCWKYSQSAWGQMNEFAGITNLPLPAPPPAIPLTATGQPDCSTPGCSAEIQQSIQQGNQQTLANTQAWYDVQGPYVPAESELLSGIFGDIPTMLLLGGVVVALVVLLPSSKGKR